MAKTTANLLEKIYDTDDRDTLDTLLYAAQLQRMRENGTLPKSRPNLGLAALMCFGLAVIVMVLWMQGF